MDPVTIISLGGACSGLVNKCGSVVKTLHNLIEAYKYADLSIMSLSEECANIQFAYSHVEQWASQDPTGSHNLGPFLNRLQQTMQSGQLVFSALEEDLKRLVPKTSSLRRRATLVWHEALFDSHRIRLRGQAASLHLLLTVISMRLDDDSLKVLQTQEHIFKDADESARSITPSQMSTHRIITGDDSASVIDPDSCWQPFMFDKELFASHVYQRSYRQVVIDRSMHSTAVKRPKSVASISTVFHVHPGTRLSGRWSLGQHSVRSFRMNKSHSTGSSLRRHSASESEKTQAELLLDETRSGSIQGSSDGRVANMTTSGNSTQPIDYPFRTPMDEATWEVYLNFENMVSSMTALLSSNVKPTKSSLTTALRALVSRMLSITNMPTIVACGSPPSKPTTCRAVSMVTTLLSQGADSSATVVRGGKRFPLLHGVIHCCCDANSRVQFITSLIIHGANVNSTGDLPHPESCRSSTKISALALAALEGRCATVKLLLDHGARFFWSDSLSIFEDFLRVKQENAESYQYIMTMLWDRRDELDCQSVLESYRSAVLQTKASVSSARLCRNEEAGDVQS